MNNGIYSGNIWRKSLQKKYVKGSNARVKSVVNLSMPSQRVFVKR